MTLLTYGERNLCSNPVEQALATKAVEAKMEKMYCIVDANIRKMLQLSSWKSKARTWKLLTSNEHVPVDISSLDYNEG